jgi:hypothetical protein
VVALDLARAWSYDGVSNDPTWAGYMAAIATKRSSMDGLRDGGRE